MSDLVIQESGEFVFVETGGSGVPLVLLHGLFGALSNFHGIINHFSRTRNVVVPILPIFEGKMRMPTVSGLVDYVGRFIDWKGFEQVHVLGNSLGGHISILYALAFSEKTVSITLTGSSGLFESGLGSTFPKRGNKEYVTKKTRAVFYDPEVATPELIDEVYDIVNDRTKALRVVWTAKSALRQNLADKLHGIHQPTLLIWGKQDTVTPPEVAEKFDELIANTKLVFMDKCGHAPMMEHPQDFNRILQEFIRRVEATVTINS